MNIRQIIGSLRNEFAWLFAIIAVGVVGLDLFDVADNGTAMIVHTIIGQRHSQQSWFVYNNTKYTFPDRYTCMSYGFFNGLRSRSPETNRTLLDSVEYGGALESRWKPIVDTPNKILRDLAKTESSKTSIIEGHINVLHNTINAAFLYRRKQRDWILKIKNPKHTYRVLLIPEENSTSLSSNFTESLQWLKHADLKTWYGDNPGFSYIDLIGADPRFLETSNGRLFSIAAVGYKDEPYLREHIVEIYFKKNETATNKNNSVILYTEDVIQTTVDIPQDPLERLRDNKNWVPFECDDQVFYVSHIWPFRVVTVEIPNPKAPWAGVARPYGNWIKAMPIPNPWKFGNPHGSTPAVRLPNGEFLSIFHSYSGLTNDRDTLQTYVMGAFTFTRHVNESKQFYMTAISTLPIIDESMYQGKWYHHYAPIWGIVDYAVFPVSLIIEGDYCFVMVANQDIHNKILKINVKTLLSTLTPVPKIITE